MPITRIDHVTKEYKLEQLYTLIAGPYGDERLALKARITAVDTVNLGLTKP